MAHTAASATARDKVHLYHRFLAIHEEVRLEQHGLECETQRLGTHARREAIQRFIGPHLRAGIDWSENGECNSSDTARHVRSGTHSTVLRYLLHCARSFCRTFSGCRGFQRIFPALILFNTGHDI